MEEIKKILETARPNDWQDIPDIDLYMDQVLSYMKRQHIGLEVDETLTAAMVNNYIKKGLLPRAKGKRYGREHIGYLTAICLLKQVISVTETGTLLQQETKEKTVEEFYSSYTGILDREFASVSKALEEEENCDEEHLADLALKLAISSYGQKLACQHIIKQLEEKAK